MNQLCNDCQLALDPSRSRYCEPCYLIREQYSRVCTSCCANVIGPEADEFVDICSDCSAPKYPCSTEGCLLTMKESWKKTCDNCFARQRIEGMRVTSTDAEQRCSNCPNPVSASWQKLCTSCYSGSAKPELIKCQVPTCNALVTRKYRKYCDSCYPASAPSTPVKQSGGTYKCSTSGCTGTTDEKWKTKCLSCYKANRRAA